MKVLEMKKGKAYQSKDGKEHNNIALVLETENGFQTLSVSDYVIAKCLAMYGLKSVTELKGKDIRPVLDLPLYPNQRDLIAKGIVPITNIYIMG